MADPIHGWFKPSLSGGDFLAAYSRVGGTHRSALVYGQGRRGDRALGNQMEWDTILLTQEQSENSNWKEGARWQIRKRFGLIVADS